MRAQRFQDALFHQLTRFFAFLVLAILVAILASLFYGALPALKEFGAGFPFSADWNPVLDKFGGDSLAETRRNHAAYLDRLAQRGLR